MAQTRRVIIWSSSTRSPYSQEISTVSPTTSPRNPPLLQNLITTCHKIKANVVTFPPAVAVQAVQDDSQPVSKEAQDKWKQHLPTGPRPSRKQGRHLRYRIYMYLVVFICIYKIYGLSAFTLSLVQDVQQFLGWISGDSEKPIVYQQNVYVYVYIYVFHKRTICLQQIPQKW